MKLTCQFRRFLARTFRPVLPQHKPSCILSQNDFCYLCAVERLVDASPFFILLDTSLFETLLINPCTMM